MPRLPSSQISVGELPHIPVKEVILVITGQNSQLAPFQCSSSTPEGPYPASQTSSALASQRAWMPIQLVSGSCNGDRSLHDDPSQCAICWVVCWVVQAQTSLGPRPTTVGKA